MRFTKEAVVTYDDFYSFMESETEHTCLYDVLSYNDSFFEDRVVQRIEGDFDFCQCVEEHNKPIALAMNAALDKFCQENQLDSFYLV